MEKKNDRAYRASLELSPYELKFANNYLNRTVSGQSMAECVLDAYPGHTNERAAASTASRLLGTPRVLSYIGAMGADAMEAVGESFETSVEYWRLRSTPAKEILAPFCEMIEVVPDDTYKPASVKLWVKSMLDIPSRYQSYVEGFLQWEGGWLVIENEMYGPKERNEARKNLDKLVGNTIERFELSGVVGQVAAQLPDGATAEEIAVLYTKILQKGKD